jgi:hypothetical protein
MAAAKGTGAMAGGAMLREIVFVEETLGDFQTKFRLRVDGDVVAANVTELETQFLVSEMLERIPSLRATAKRRRRATLADSEHSAIVTRWQES